MAKKITHKKTETKKEVKKKKISDYVKSFLLREKYSLIILFVFTIVLLAYWPGILVSDSMVQWDQTQTGMFTNWHPAYNTIYICLLTKIWNNPGFVLFIQSIILSFSIGEFLYRLEKYYKVNKIFLLICSLLISILPINFNAAVILLKDTIYSALIVVLANISLDIINNEDYLDKKKNALKIGFVYLAIMLSRHNGILTVVLFALLLIVLYRKKKLLYVSTVCSIVLYFLMTTVGFKVFNIVQDNYANKYGPISHIYARILNEQPELLSDEDMEKLSEFVDIQKLKDTFNPTNMDFSINSQKIDVIKEKGNEYIKLAISTFFKNPLIFIKHYLVLDSFLYNPVCGNQERYAGLFIETDLWIYKDKYNYLNENSKIDWLLPGLKKYSNLYQRGRLGDITMRPPLYLYFGLIITFLLAKFRKHKKIWIVSLLSLFNIVGLAIAMPVPMTRYVYSTILIGQLLFIFGFYELFIYIKGRFLTKNEK